MLSGQIDTLVLYILSRDNSYGLDIYKQLKDITQHRFELKETTLYSAYKRLETKGYITSYWGDETNGARRKYYSITQLGIEELIKMTDIWKEVFRILLSIYETVKIDAEKEK